MVATALTVYGIGNLGIGSGLTLISSVVTALTVYGIETISLRYD